MTVVLRALPRVERAPLCTRAGTTWAARCPQVRGAVRPRVCWDSITLPFWGHWPAAGVPWCGECARVVWAPQEGLWCMERPASREVCA